MLKDATYLANLIKNKKLSPNEALDEMEKRARQNKGLNAFVELDINKAKEHVKKIESKKNQMEMPFFGVPYPLKDLGQSKKGFKETFGSRLFKDNRANRSNNYTKRIESAGFIPFGVTTAPEFGFKNVTDSQLHKVTKNPLDKTRYPGGSSGGAASVVASGISPIAGASDGGGSIRIPASFTGLIGLKPSRGLIVTGPDDYRNWQGASVNFGLTISIRDTQRLFSLLQADNQFSPFNAPRRTNILGNRPLKIAVCTDSPVGNRVSDEAIKAVTESAEFLETLGHEIEWIDYPVNGDKLINSYYQMNGGETAHLFEKIEKKLEKNMAQSDMELMTWTLYQYGKKLSASDYIASFSEWDKATVIMETLFKEYDLFLSPTATTIAPKIETDLQSDVIRNKMAHASELNKTELAQLVYEMFEKSLWLTPYTQLANLTGEPAISLPVHQTKKEGLPIGIQLMAAKGNDPLLLAIGKYFEENERLKIPNSYHD